MTIEEIRAERDYFRAAYERKLNEHSETLSDAVQLCKERDEARAKLAEFGVVTRCQNCGGTGKDARGSDCCRIPGHAKECACFMCQWKNAFYSLEREANEERAKLAATVAHCATLRAALEGAFKELKALFPGDTYLPAERALAATPAECAEELRENCRRELLTWMQKPVTEMETRDPAAYLIVSAFIDKVRQQAGRDRAVRELRAIAEHWREQAQGGPDTGHASVLFLRADEIAQEGK